ncbi:methyltransferase domain-containing protein [Nocardioides sp. ChNu-99]|uniref:class I SAM-dependent methyltransferase n=1 Tax=Nocardioides sp. ChNu-99 TaxID=2839897 RepID=UPI002404AC9D|nr:methyltransferase domain-containing protein [Nocardioides sp. ChNu-99]MDF9714843.1 class I SAM-dependent methyltransferase [Nocardioides sp. ChNu-99]
MTELSFSELFARALNGTPCTVIGAADASGDAPEALPVGEWRRPAQKSDLAVLDLCEGVTIDVGCGPGRMAAALAERGHDVLAIDVVAESVRLARERGVVAMQHDVFEALPHEGRWTTVLLADGNVGIGGDPATLLRRVRELVEPRGRVVVDLAGPGVGIASRWARLQCGDDVSRPFRWSVVGVDAIEDLARAAGLEVLTLHVVDDDEDERWTAVLGNPAPATGSGASS